ncbi:MAG: hypothetical protein D6702_07155 [Planctomycetota bacterium]|nr:MAG: hypothetical protein D6702_07155 [Planctomycetota bacterium]
MLLVAVLLPAALPAVPLPQDPPRQRGRGLHGYIGYQAEQPPDRAEYGYGMSFYSAAWTLVEQPLARFQVGLAGCWILPDNRDDRDRPLAPEGTLARTWKERGPTWASVFQTIEGGLGYWRGNRFRYGPPKFSMNATPQCYDYEIGSPGWSFFYDTQALPDERLGLAQLSNRLLVPPDGLPFAGEPDGDFLGYAWMALPFTDPVPARGGRAPTGPNSWTCFLAADNFKGPIAFFVPETWSKIADLFREPYLHGRGLDSRPGLMNGGAMEINTVPQLVARDAAGRSWSKIPSLRFPIDDRGRAVLVEDVTYWSRAALWDEFLAWRRGGPAPSGAFSPNGAFRARLLTRTPAFDQDGLPIEGVAETFDTAVFPDGSWGLIWKEGGDAPPGRFPQFFRHEDGRRVAVSADEVPAETGLQEASFEPAGRGPAFTSPARGAWIEPGPAAGPFTTVLGDGSRVTYCWYRFIDQPVFQQYRWSESKKRDLQELVERLHRAWPIDRDYLPPPTSGRLVRLDPALLVEPPPGMEAGYVPIVVRQEDGGSGG